MKEYKNLVGEYVIEYRAKKHTKVKIKSSQTASDFAREVWPGSLMVRESFIVLMLNKANNVTGYYVASQGGLSGTVVDNRLILHVALQSLSSSMILVHNHPSGNTQPSDADKLITAKIKAAAEYMEIKVLDHIILTEERYFSFADEGLINHK